jgi:SulP family sulfate permease
LPKITASTELHASHLWDASTIATLDAITEKYRRHGKDVEIIGLNDASVLMRECLGGKLSAGN